MSISTNVSKKFAGKNGKTYTGITAFAVVLTLLALIVLITLSILAFFSWLAMLTIGALSTFTAIPAYGFWQVFVGVVAVWLLAKIIGAGARRQ